MKEKAGIKQKVPISSERKTISPDIKIAVFNKILPHAAAVILFAIITCLYFSPMIFDNKVLFQSDIVQGKGMAKELSDYRAQMGKEALWTNSMFGGMPAYQITVFYKGNLLQYLDDLLYMGFPHPARLFFLAFLCFYFLMISVGITPWLSIAGAIGYTLSSYDLIIIAAGHNTKMHAIALLPLAVAGIIMLRNGRYVWGGIITAVALSLQIYANHLQITYYLMLLMIVYGIVELIYAIREKDFKRLLISAGVAAIAATFAVLTNLSMLWSTKDYVPSTIRGPSELSSNKQSTGGLDKDYAYQWSYGKMETFTLLIPNFFGGVSGSEASANSQWSKLINSANLPPDQRDSYLKHEPLYWGDQPFTGGPVYVGAIFCLLFILGLFLIRDRWRWWLLTVSVLAIMLSWGRNMMWFSDLFFYYFPGYNKFRVVAMILVLVQFTFPFMGIMVLWKIIRGDFTRQEVIQKLKWSFYIVGGLCLFFALFGTSFFSFTGNSDVRYQSQQEVINALISDRKDALRTDAFRSFVFVLLSASVIWLYVNDRIKKNIFMGGITLLIFIDLFTVGKRYLTADNFTNQNQYNEEFQPTAVDQFILKESSKDYRVLNLASDTWNDSHTSYFHKSVGGYHAAKLRRYQEIIEHQLDRKDLAAKKNLGPNISVLNMLNAKYIIVPSKDQGEQVQPNPGALDNAWFADSIKIVQDADEEMSALNDFNPATTAIIDKRYSSQLSGYNPVDDLTSSIVLEKYEPNDLIYKSTSSKDRVAVFSEIYYQPGWNAYLDGKKTDHFRCNYILRGMRIPGGSHTIEFKFEPASYYVGEKVAYASSVLVLLLLTGAGLREFLKYRTRNRNQT
ncbi:MAG: YfhO family protein [Chitinophagales bacterium]|nr:YfhO family protein [Chitinophagales bacterium]